MAASITSNPISITVLEKATATLLCEATASGPIRYQWRRVNGEISSDRAEGVNTSTLTIPPVQQEDEDEYYCVASYGVVNGMDHSDESERAKITVFGTYHSETCTEQSTDPLTFRPSDPFDDLERLILSDRTVTRIICDCYISQPIDPHHLAHFTQPSFYNCIANINC